MRNHTPESFTGMNAYYNDTSSKAGKNILPAWDYIDPAINATSKAAVEAKQSKTNVQADDGGRDYSKIWLIVFGEKRTHAIVPNTAITGIQMWMDPKPRVKDDDEGSQLVYSSQFTMDYGLVPEDWRYNVVGENIHMGVLSRDPKYGVNLVDMMEDMDGKLPAEGGENYRAAWFMPKKLKTILNVQRRRMGFDAGNTSDWAGRRGSDSFLDYPIFKSDTVGLKNARLKFAA